MSLTGRTQNYSTDGTRNHAGSSKAGHGVDIGISAWLVDMLKWGTTGCCFDPAIEYVFRFPID